MKKYTVAGNIITVDFRPPPPEPFDGEHRMFAFELFSHVDVNRTAGRMSAKDFKKHNRQAAQKLARYINRKK